jgi:uncharacterized protein (DUF2236 family)
MTPLRSAIILPPPLQRRLEAAAGNFIHPDSGPEVDFGTPAGEPALMAPDSVSWQVFKNPLALFIGGIAAVILELAEPRVRTGVWNHTTSGTIRCRACNAPDWPRWSRCTDRAARPRR